MNKLELEIEVAKLVFEAMRFDRKNQTPSWVERGNAPSQTEARATAHAILETIKNNSSSFIVCGTCEDAAHVATAAGAADCPDCVERRT
jgi:DeoR/GlpR family transcriptional regulator of sugar metabolism